MSAFKVLDVARAAGVEIRLDGKELQLSATGEPATDVIDTLRRHKLSIVSLLQGRLLALRQPIEAWDPADWRAYFDERAGIAEFDGGLRRAEAEARAYDFCVAEWLFRNPICSSPDRCLECATSARIDDQLLAIGVVGAGQAWLHRDCIPAWRAARLAAAVTALSAMGIVATPGTSGTSEEIDRCAISLVPDLKGDVR